MFFVSVSVFTSRHAGLNLVHGILACVNYRPDENIDRRRKRNGSGFRRDMMLTQEEGHCLRQTSSVYMLIIGGTRVASGRLAAQDNLDDSKRRPF